MAIKSPPERPASWINLDNAKLIKEGACSEIHIQKSGKKLDILINSGALYAAETGASRIIRIESGEVTALAVREKFRAGGYPISHGACWRGGDTLYVCDNFHLKSADSLLGMRESGRKQ